MKWLQVVLIGLALFNNTTANPYLEQVETAVPTAEEMDRAREQVAAPRPQALSEPLFVPPFHKRSSVQDSPRTLCRFCHSGPPHHSDPGQRSFLNVHSRHLACETCHWRPQGQIIEYRFGGEDAVSVIVPQVGDEPVQTSIDHPEARRIIDLWEGADDEAKAGLKARLHRPLSKKGPDCGACHGAVDSMLDLPALGYDSQRARALRLNPIARFLQRMRGESGQPVRRIHLRELLE